MDKRYLINHNTHGILLAETTGGTFWQRNDGEHDTMGDSTVPAPTFTKEEGEEVIAQMAANWTEAGGYGVVLPSHFHLTECTADTNLEQTGPGSYASRRAMASRGLCTDPKE